MVCASACTVDSGDLEINPPDGVQRHIVRLVGLDAVYVTGSCHGVYIEVDRDSLPDIGSHRTTRLL